MVVLACSLLGLELRFSQFWAGGCSRSVGGVCCVGQTCLLVSRAVEARSVQARGSLPVTHLERNSVLPKILLNLTQTLSTQVLEGYVCGLRSNFVP